jgi:hypothetical protein
METLPYNILQFNETSDEPSGTSYSEQAIPLQEELNWLLTITNTLAKSLRRIVLAHEEGLAEGEKAKLDSLNLIEVILTKNPNPETAFGELKVGGSFQEILPLLFFVKDEMRTLLGISEMDRGNRINVETADESARVGAGAAAQRGRNQGPWEDFLSDAIGVFASAVAATAAERITIPILGDEDAAELFASGPQSGFATFDKAEIEGDFIYRVRPGSTLPIDPNAELKRELALNQALSQEQAVNWPQRLIETMRAADKDPRKQLATPDLVRQVAENKAAAPEGANGGAGQGGSVSPGLAELLGRGAAGSA